MTDHSALIERLESMGRSHRAHEIGLRKRLAAGDRSLSVQDPDNAARSAETCEKASAALRDLSEQKPFAYFQWNEGWRAWEQVVDKAANHPRVVAAYRLPLPSAPNQAKEAGE